MSQKHHWLCEKKHLHHPFLLSTFLGKIALMAVLVIHALPLTNIGANMFVADLSVEKLNYEDASETLENHFNQLKEKPVILEFEGEKYQVNANKLGIELNVYKTVENIYQAEYGDNLWDTGKHFISSLVKETHVNPVFEINEEQFAKGITEAIPAIQNPKNAQVIINDEGQFEVIPHTDGLRALTETPKLSLLQSLKNFKTSTLQIQSEVIEADVNENEAQEAATRAQIYIEEPFTFTFTENGEIHEYIVRFDREWIDFETPNEGGVYSSIKRERLGQYITEKISPEINITNQDAILKEMPKEGSDYAVVEGIVKDGRLLRVDKTLEKFYETISHGEQSTELIVEEIKGRIINQTGVNLGTLELLSTGKSNFEGSPAGRDFNIRKGMTDKVDSILLAPGAEYNFNKNLGPVTNSAGWKNSLAIFGGKDLRPVPGGGLCQVATTVYRAAVYAGLTIKERSNHSLYVHYYTPYGDGLDAAIYPGSKNLKFENNTPHYILIQAYTEGDDAYVNVYGTPDGRKVELIGPFYPSGTYPDGQERLKEKTSIRSNQIAWWQIIHDAEGNLLEEKQVTASYRTVPRNL